MELNQLRYYIALARLCSYSKAAEELYVAQSTLSQQIKKLEEELDVRLFDRSTRKVELTPAGVECLPKAEQILSDIESLQRTAAECSKIHRRPIRLGVLSVYPSTNVSDVLEEFQTDHPDIALHISFAPSVSLLDTLMRGKVDAVIANISLDSLDADTLAKLSLDTFLEDRLHVVLSKRHKLSGRQLITVEDILDDKLLFASKNASVRLRLYRALRMKGYALPDFIECPSLSTMFNFIQRNMGISVMSSHVACAYLQADMECIPIDPPLQTQTALVILRERTFPELDQFADYFHVNLDRPAE